MCFRSTGSQVYIWQWTLTKLNKWAITWVVIYWQNSTSGWWLHEWSSTVQDELRSILPYQLANTRPHYLSWWGLVCTYAFITDTYRNKEWDQMYTCKISGSCSLMMMVLSGAPNTRYFFLLEETPSRLHLPFAQARKLDLRNIFLERCCTWESVKCRKVSKSWVHTRSDTSAVHDNHTLGGRKRWNVLSDWSSSQQASLEPGIPVCIYMYLCLTHVQVEEDVYTWMWNNLIFTRKLLIQIESA